MVLNPSHLNYTHKYIQTPRGFTSPLSDALQRPTFRDTLLTKMTWSDNILPQRPSPLWVPRRLSCQENKTKAEAGNGEEQWLTRAWIGSRPRRYRPSVYHRTKRRDSTVGSLGYLGTTGTPARRRGGRSRGASWAPISRSPFIWWCTTDPIRVTVPLLLLLGFRTSELSDRFVFF